MKPDAPTSPLFWDEVVAAKSARLQGNTPASVSVCLGDVTGDASQSVRDVARKQGESGEDGNRDDGQDDAVLGHRLPVFSREPRVELLHWYKPPGRVGDGYRRLWT